MMLLASGDKLAATPFETTQRAFKRDTHSVTSFFKSALISSAMKNFIESLKTRDILHMRNKNGSAGV